MITLQTFAKCLGVILVEILIWVSNFSSLNLSENRIRRSNRMNPTAIPHIMRINEQKFPFQFKRKTFPLNIRMMMTSTLQFILTYPTTQSMTWEFLFFYTHQPKNCPEKPWRKKSSLSLEQLPHLD